MNYLTPIVGFIAAIFTTVAFVPRFRERRYPEAWTGSALFCPAKATKKG